MTIYHFDVDVSFSKLLTGRKFRESLQDIPGNKKFYCDAISIKSNSKVDAHTLSHFPDIKLIITRTVGTDHINLVECKKRNIAVYRIIDYGAFAVAEHALALMLYGARRIGEAEKKVHSGIFSYENLCGNTIYGKTVGIVGTGRIGLEFIKLLKPFHPEILAYDIFQNKKAEKDLGFNYVDFRQLLKLSDFISLHAPLTDKTHHLISVDAISQMKDHGVLINCARGGLIDTDALIRHIKKFLFVGLDVLEDEEYFDKHNPLLKFSNVLITPHISFFTDSTVKKIAEETQKCLERFLSGDIYGLVTK